MTLAFALSRDPFPATAASLEEACAAGPRDVGALIAFALDRRAVQDSRPVLLTATRGWLQEHGRPNARGLGQIGLILTPVSTPGEGLWVLEQALRSGAVSLALGAVQGVTLAQSRRLIFAAEHGGAMGVMLPGAPEGLTAARRRWRIASAPSAPDLFDPRAPGLARLVAELTRGRGERPGAWMLERDDETHRFRLADRLADRGLASVGRTGVAASLAA